MNWEVIVSTVGWVILLLGGAYKVGKLTQVVEDIRDNHLPHIYDELKYLRERLDKL